MFIMSQIYSNGKTIIAATQHQKIFYSLKNLKIFLFKNYVKCCGYISRPHPALFPAFVVILRILTNFESCTDIQRILTDFERILEKHKKKSLKKMSFGFR